MRGIELTKEEREARKARLTEQGRRLADLRKGAGLTQKELAAKIREAGGPEISTGLVKLIEIGERDLTPEKLRACAGIFCVRPGYITGESPYKDRTEELLAKLPEDDRIWMEGRRAVLRAAERWIRASLPDESLEDLEAQDRLCLFEVFCDVTETIKRHIWRAKLPKDVWDRINRGEISEAEVYYNALED